MRYNQPLGGDADDPYVDGDPANGTPGSPVPAAALEHAQREIVNLIAAGGLVPNANDLEQAAKSVQAMIANSVVSPVSHIALVIDQKASNVDGGGALAGGSVRRDLNTILINNIGLTLGSNNFTLPVGDYYMNCSSVAGDLLSHILWLKNETTGVNVITGSLERTEGANTYTKSTIKGPFAVTDSSHVFSIQHFAQRAININDLGFQSGNSLFPSVYTQMEITA